MLSIFICDHSYSESREHVRIQTSQPQMFLHLDNGSYTGTYVHVHMYYKSFN